MAGIVRKTKFDGDNNESNFALRMDEIWTIRTMVGGQPSPFRKQCEHLVVWVSDINSGDAGPTYERADKKY